MTMNISINYPEQLPIVAQKDKIIKAFDNYDVIVVSGDTGSGKTTQLPKMCLQAGRGQDGIIGCTQPRRIAAISMADRVAEELGPENSSLVAYKIRFTDRTGPQTRIKFMTDGILLAETRSDKQLNAYDTLIIDEAHERSLNIDFLLGYLQQLLNTRNDLKIIISSATIDTDKFARHFNNSCIIKVTGRSYPIEVRYCPAETEEIDEVSIVDQAVAAVHKIRATEKPGDILVFMPTERDIRETVERLSGGLDNPNIPETRWGQCTILPLFGRMHGGEQKRIFGRIRGQKIVIATNVAETSITVPGIRYVVDTGVARIAFYNPRARTTKMPVSRISKSSCDQRMGRCGRTAPGICVRLFSEDDYNSRPQYTLPEIKRSDMAEIVLRLTDLNIGDPKSFPFIDPPSAGALSDGYTHLRELGAMTDRNELTPHGRLMARLPLDPRIARMIIEARDMNALQETIIITAALTIQDPRIRPADREKEADRLHEKFTDRTSDFLTYLKLWELFHQTMTKVKSHAIIRKFCSSHFLSYQRIREWRDIHEQISNILSREKKFIINSKPADSEAVHRSILSGCLRNIALKKAKNVYQGTHGKEVYVFPGSALYNKSGAWIMAAELIETTRLYARCLATIQPEWIEPVAAHLCHSTYANPRWEKKTGRVIADEKVSLSGLIIVAGRRVNFADTGPDARMQARDIFIREALIQGNLGGRFPFLDHNLKLIDKLQGMEDRLRQRGLLADEETQFDFYSSRIGDVCDQQGLVRLLKKNTPLFLRMTEEDVLSQTPDATRLIHFPSALLINNIAYRLTYRFEPGSEDDGVTLTLPMADSAQLKPEILEWLVPGLLQEKIIFLLKGLPKSTRKKLIPLQKTALEMFETLTSCDGSLYDKLAEAVFKQFRVGIQRNQWPLADLPPHLCMRISLVDDSGTTIRQGRDYFALVGHSPAETVADINDQLRRQWERDGITDWDFKNLPDKIAIHKGNAPGGFVFPGLVAEQPDSIAIRLFSSHEESSRATRSGLITCTPCIFLCSARP